MQDDYLEFWDEHGVGHQVSKSEFSRREQNTIMLAKRIKRLDGLEEKFAKNAGAWFIVLVIANVLPILLPTLFTDFMQSGYVDAYKYFFALWFWGSIGWYAGFVVTKSMVKRTVPGDRVPSGQFVILGTILGLSVAYLFEVGITIGQ